LQLDIGVRGAGSELTFEGGRDGANLVEGGFIPVLRERGEPLRIDFDAVVEVKGEDARREGGRSRGAEEGGDYGSRVLQFSAND
jgi:hypothetical protein